MDVLGSSWGGFGEVLGGLGDVLGRLEASWSRPETSWGVLGAQHGGEYIFWDRLGERFGGHLGDLGPNLGTPRHPNR